MTSKQYNELLAKYGAAELAASFVFPVKQPKKQKAETDKVLSLALKQSRALAKPHDRLNARLMQLRFMIDDYLKEMRFEKQKTFGFFLKLYMRSWNKRQNQIAREISIPATVLSQYTNGFRKPSHDVLVRLELHSNNIIPAASWYQLLQKEELHNLKADKSLRLQQKEFVKKERIAA